MVAAFVASAYAFNKGIHTIVDQTNEASSRIVDENFEWLLAACYVLYLTSSRVISGVWRLTGSRGLAVYLWDCICVPSITFLSLLAITPAKFQSGYISLLLHQDRFGLLVLFLASGIFPGALGVALYKSSATQYLIDRWRSTGTTNLIFSRYPPVTPSDITP